MSEKILLESLKKTNRLYAVISNVNNMILHISEKDKIFQEACRIAVEEGLFEMSWVGLLDEQTGAIKPICWAGKEDGYLHNMQEISAKNIPEGRGPTGSAVRDGHTFVANDFATDPRVAPWRDEGLKRGYASSIAIPIITNAKVIGAFTIYSSEINFFNAIEIKQLEDLTKNIAFALEKIETERLRQQAVLEVVTKNELIKTIINSLPGLISYWTRDFRCSFANHGYLEWFGKTEEEMLGIHLQEFYSDELNTETVPYIAGVLAGEKQQFERRLTKADGSIGFLLVQFVPHIVNLEHQGFIVLGTDITKIKEAEIVMSNRASELEQLHSKYVSLLENMSEGILLIDFDYACLLINSAMAGHYGTTKEELLGFSILEKIPGIKKTSFFTKLKTSMDQRISQRFEDDFIFPDERKQSFEIHITPSPRGLLIMSQDITERNRIRDELVLSNKAREEEALFSASKMAALGEMASGIAHEINNPLAIIIMKISVLLRKQQTELLDQEELTEGLIKIASTAQRIGKVVKGLSAISRHSANDPMQKIKLDAVIEETLQLCRERFKSHSIVLDADLSGISNITIEARAPQIMQVFLNLLNNAFDAVSPLNEKWVSIETMTTENGVAIQVTDSGPGIPDYILGRMMQPFFTTKEAGKGTGLGLSISKGIIEEHQGHIYYKKHTDHTNFVIELPLAQKYTQI